MRSAVVLVLVLLSCLSRAQHQALIDYLERRLLAIEDRISLWHEQTARYASELRELKQQMVQQLETLDKEKETLRTHLDGVGTRVDRVERELDYLETQNGGAAPCVDVDDKLMEQQVNLETEKNRGKYSKLSDCRDMISSIKAMKILKRLGGSKGTWSRDMTERSSGKVFVFNGTDGDSILEFSSVQEFTSSPGTTQARVRRLPSAWRGTGHVVYKNHAYYVKEEDGTPSLVRYDLRNSSVVDGAVFPLTEQVPVYALNPETLIDLSVDEEGLWAVYARQQLISLAKMDPNTLDLEQSWDTSCPRDNAEAAFLICGTLYVVYNTPQPGRSRVQCVFDVSGLISTEEAPLVYFPKRYGSHASIKYNPLEQLLYAWDHDGYQILYKLQMKQKLEI